MESRVGERAMLRKSAVFIISLCSFLRSSSHPGGVVIITAAGQKEQGSSYRHGQK